MSLRYLGDPKPRSGVRGSALMSNVLDSFYFAQYNVIKCFQELFQPFIGEEPDTVSEYEV